MNKVEKRFADKIGAEYALFPLAAPHYEEFQGLVAEISAIHTSKVAPVLEIGCGTGLTTQQLHRRRPTLPITAIDLEEVMIAQAKVAVIDQRVSFVCADALEFLKTQPDDSYGRVITVFCLHNTPPEYRSAVFMEIGRILKKGGIIVVGDKIAQDDVLEHWQALREQIDAFAVFQTTEYPELQAEWTEHYLEDDRIRLTEHEQRELLKLAGCHAVNFHGRWRMDAVFSGVKDSSLPGSCLTG